MTETLPPRLGWRAAEVVETRPETPRAVTIRFAVPEWPGHRAGQHVDVRLTAEDGYQAQRSYSIASAPEMDGIELTVERLDDGEVSPYLTEELLPGDQIELRGPIGGYFAWSVEDGGPLLLVGGGSGIVPLMAMLRHRAAQKSRVPATLLCSFRNEDEIIYQSELAQLAEAEDTLRVVRTLTRHQPAGWTGYTRRIDRAMLAEVAGAPSAETRAFVCGPTALVETVASELVALGLPPAQVKTERFGPTAR